MVPSGDLKKKKETKRKKKKGSLLLRQGEGERGSRGRGSLGQGEACLRQIRNCDLGFLSGEAGSEVKVWFRRHLS